MALGMGGESIFRDSIVDHTEPFAVGDGLVLYTGGIIEAPNEDGQGFSGARLGDVVRSFHHRSVRELNDVLLEHVRRFTGEMAPRDGVTLLAVKRH